MRKFNSKPAVNRQPMFPREMTRRADFACPPANSLNEFQRILQRTRSKNKRKHRFSMKIMIFGATVKNLVAFGKSSNEFCGTSPSGKTFLKLQARGEPSTNVPSGDDSQSRLRLPAVEFSQRMPRLLQRTRSKNMPNR